MFEFAASSPDFCLLTLRAQGKTEIAGFICYRIAKELEISTLAVRQDLRRSGLGTLLVRRALSDGSTARTSAAHLNVRVSNIAGRRLYERLGFMPLALEVDYYHDPTENGLIYWRPIDRAAP
jgi:ribosomal protein S18 acetylase RimI-like enzyme